MKKRLVTLVLFFVVSVLGACTQREQSGRLASKEEVTVLAETLDEPVAETEALDEPMTEASELAYVPEGAEVYMRYHGDMKDFRIWKSKDTFYLARKKRVLATTELKEELLPRRGGKSSWYPYVQSSTGNLYIIQARIENPKLEFVKVANDCEEIIGELYDYKGTYNFVCVPLYKNKNGHYVAVMPESTYSWHDYVEFSIFESAGQTAEYNTVYKKISFSSKDIYVDIDCMQDDGLAWNNTYYVKKGKKEMILYAEKEFPEIRLQNHFAVDIIRWKDSNKLNEFIKEKVPLKKQEAQLKKVNNYLENWILNNAETIVEYYTKYPQKLKVDYTYETVKPDIREWLEKNPVNREKLINNNWRYFLKDK